MASQPDVPMTPTPPPRLLRSLASVMAGSLVLRAAASAMSENLQFYFNAIDAATQSPSHPLRRIAGIGGVYHISYGLGGVIIGTFFVTEIIGAVILGAWSDRRGRKPFILFGPLLGALAVQLTALTTALWLLIVTRLLEGLSTASNAPATLGYLAEATQHSPRLRTRVMGLFEIATLGGVALGLSLGGWLWQHFGTPARLAGVPFTSPAFALNAAAYLASFVILGLGLREIPRERRAPQLGSTARESWNHYTQIVHQPRVAGFVAAWIAINAVLGVWINLIPRLLTDRGPFSTQLLVGHLNSRQAGNLQAVYAAVFVIGILMWSLFFAQLDRLAAMLIGAGGLLLSCGLLLALNHQPALTAPAVVPLAALLVVGILIQSGFTPAALGHLADVTAVHAADRGVLMGWYSVFLGLGQFLGASLGGLFVDWRGADGLLVFMVLLGLAAAAILLRLRASED